jgi:hypothetical protein
MRTVRIVSVVAALAATCALVHADFSYQESAQMTGGTMLTVLKLGGPFTRGARAAQISTVAIKGNRMLRSDKDSTSIIDLDKETITDIDISKKTYSVTTFAQIRAAMEKAVEEAKKRDKSKDTKGAEMKFKVTAKATGETKEIRTLTAKELVIGMEMQATDTKTGETGSFNMANEAWMANVAGYDQVKVFELKMAQKMAAAFRPGMEQMATTQPMMVQGMAEAAKEMAKVDGVPIQSVMRMGSGTVEDLEAAGKKSEADKGDGKGKSGGAVAGAIAGRITGIGGFGRKKADDNKQDKQAKDDGKAPAAVILMEMTTNLSEFSTGPVDEAKFQIPAGFKEVLSDMTKRAK